MNRRPLQPAGKPATQSGVALVICLIFLLVLTLLGITAMRTTGLEERMAGNARNGEIAFQAAEAGLREGEEWVMAINLYNPPTPCSSAPCQLWQADAAGLPDNLYQQNLAWWQTNGRQYTQQVPEAGADPHYLVEYIGYDPGLTVIETEKRAMHIGPHFYRVTAAGFGGDTAAQRVLQSTVRTYKN